ncbi:Bicarbonate transport system permease protein CmpB [Nocardia otitidiscaviarum]|uniref:Bicarbonate transport system permease protein CmpB n=1 Tax=Nocardia otitidiscaviarum TaxID=1823 RepID=A0A379JKD0_9NOCA|nr:ABC transporter permease [Nocardia otitidiscaviarum]SUD48443.1 Bicarbonate transport system permease protein CmpB [Nocardia otitidiscaviarum]
MTTTDARVRAATDTTTEPAAPARERAVGQRLRPARHLLPVLPVLGAVLAWHVVTEMDLIAWLRFDKLPGPLDVAASLRRQLESGVFYEHMVASLRRILSGFAIAAVLGVAAGMAIGRSRIAAALLRPLLEVARPIPAIALVPIAILLFPTSEQGIVFITCFAAFFPVTVSTIHAMKALPQVWTDAARTLGANRWQVLFHVVLPGAMPAIFSGLSVGMGVAWICVISAEMISGQFGVGYWTWMSYSLLDYAGVVTGMLTIGALGYGTAWVIERVGRRVNHWLPGEAR